MSSVKLDAVDRRILKTLQEDGRISNVDLAAAAGITPPPCLRRVRALEEAAIIRGYHADIDPQKLGYGLTVFAMVGLHSQHESDLRAFEDLARSWPLVRECHMLNGEIDFILKIVARDLNQFQTFLTGELTPAPNVAAVKTSFTIRSAKQEPGAPIEV